MPISESVLGDSIRVTRIDIARFKFWHHSLENWGGGSPTASHIKARQQHFPHFRVFVSEFSAFTVFSALFALWTLLRPLFFWGERDLLHFLHFRRLVICKTGWCKTGLSEQGYGSYMVHA